MHTDSQNCANNFELKQYFTPNFMKIWDNVVRRNTWYSSNAFRFEPDDSHTGLKHVAEQLVKSNNHQRFDHFSKICSSRGKRFSFKGPLRLRFRLQQFGRRVAQCEGRSMSVQRAALWPPQQQLLRAKGNVHRFRSRGRHVWKHTDNRHQAVQQGVGKFPPDLGQSQTDGLVFSDTKTEVDLTENNFLIKLPWFVQNWKSLNTDKTILWSKLIATIYGKYREKMESL